MLSVHVEVRSVFFSTARFSRLQLNNAFRLSALLLLYVIACCIFLFGKMRSAVEISFVIYHSSVIAVYYLKARREEVKKTDD